MPRQKAIFEEIFDGPDSLFGRIFGELKDVGTGIHEEFFTKKKQVVSVVLSNDQFEKLRKGHRLVFKTPHERITLERGEGDK